MPRKFLTRQSSFSEGQVSKDFKGASSADLHSTAVLGIKNFVLNNGSSLSKRGGFKYERNLRFFSTRGEHGDDLQNTSVFVYNKNDRISFFQIGTQRMALTHDGVFYEYGDTFELAQLFRPLEHVRPSSNIRRATSDGHGNLFPYRSRGKKTYEMESYNELGATIYVEGNLAMISIGDEAPFFVVRNFAIPDSFTVVSVFRISEYFYTSSEIAPSRLSTRDAGSYTTDSEASKMAQPFRPVPKSLLLDVVRKGNGDVLLPIGFNPTIDFPPTFPDYPSAVTGSDIPPSNIYIITFNNGTDEHRYKFIPSGGVSSSLRGGKYASYNVVGLNDSSVDLDTVLGADPDTTPPEIRSDEANAVGLFGDGSQIIDPAFSDIRIFECEWYEGNYPDGISLENRLMLFKGSQVWASATESVFDFFDYGFFVDNVLSVQSQATAKSIQYSQFRSLDERIVNIKKGTASVFIFTDRNIYTVDEDIYNSSSFSYISNESVLPKTDILTVDSSFYLINRLGELIRIVYNFNESAFNVVNLSKKLFYNSQIDFVSIHLSDKYSNYLFARASDGRLFVLYIDNSAKINSWSYIDFGDIQSVSVTDDILVVKNNIELYSLDYFQKGVPVDGWSVFSNATVRGDGLIRLGLTDNGSRYLANRDLSKLCAFPSLGGVVDYSTPFTITFVGPDYVLDHSVGVTATTFLVGESIEGIIDLLPISANDKEGDAYYQYKVIDNVLVSTEGKEGLTVKVNDVSVSSKTNLGEEEEVESIQEFVGFPENERELKVSVSHSKFSSIKIFGISIMGYVK